MLSERVTAIEPDGSLQLEKSGKVALANLRLPESNRAESWLAEHVLQQSITCEALAEDRYGRTLITSPIAERLLRDGVAMIYASSGTVPVSWRTAEATARSKKLGIWKDEMLVLNPQNAAQHLGGFHIIEGKVTRIYEGKSATYLNFGDDWHTDFSITIPGKLRRSMKADLAVIKPGSTISVRGALFAENGPMLLLNHRDNLEHR